jgi:hypothetical protein
VTRPVIREQIADNYPTVELSSIPHLTCPTSLGYCDVSLRPGVQPVTCVCWVMIAVSYEVRYPCFSDWPRWISTRGNCRQMVRAGSSPRSRIRVRKRYPQRRLIMPISDQAYAAGVVAAARHSARHRVRPPLAICWRQKMLCISLQSVPQPIILANANPDEARSYKSAVPIDV